ncbi:hypothetical protein KVQ82_26195 [Pseudomonas sp. AO-1]|uniref:hypothetical protein n=1 Tax=Pseudomonas sp. AO-1 TaxID=2855434 RepID=UPI001C75C865|nr:hypothetical protein [Pseudomonas sp. AO-1]QXZ13532.1 hypothetical protein KVQ82_26195 [Pseudomonas sp. AO-1]
MFRLNDAVRRFQSKNQTPVLRCVATSVAKLSPDVNRDIPQVVATVAAVAASSSDPVDTKLLIQQMRNDGVVLHHHENTLHIRPRHWHQLDQISGYWKAMLLFLQTNENG